MNNLPGNSLVLVDDDPIILKSASLMLKKKGYQVNAFNSPDVVLQFIAADPTSVDLVITDQMMPEMTGLDLAKELREIAPDIPIVILTGFYEAVLEAEDAKANVDAVHAKPMVVSEVEETIASLIQPDDELVSYDFI